MRQPLVLRVTVDGGNLVLRWNGEATVEDTDDLTNWSHVPGNPTSPWTVPINEGNRFFRLRAEP